MSKGEGRGIQSIDIGGRLLSVLIESDRPMMLKDLAAISDLPAAQAHAYLSSFRRCDLVEQDSATGRYQLGPLAIQLGLARISSFAPLRAVREAASALEAELGLMVALVVWGVNAPTVIQVQAGSFPLNVNLRPGMTLPIAGSAAGRVFAAFSDCEGLNEMLDQELSANGEKAADAARTAFEAEVAEIRKTGYAITRSQPVPDIDTIAVPVKSSDGAVIAVISVVGSVVNLDTSPAGQPLTSLIQAANRLSQGRYK